VRRKIALTVAGLAVAASFAPLGSASAFCSEAWQQVTGQCSPCNTVGPAYNNLDNRLGGALPTLNCLA
jgi:hypothetical protein